MDINNHLEQEWKSYKSNSIFKSPLFILLILVLIGTALFFGFVSEKSSESVVQKKPVKAPVEAVEKQKPVKPQKVAEKIVEKKAEPVKVEKKEEKAEEPKVAAANNITLTPTFSFEKDLKKESSPKVVKKSYTKPKPVKKSVVVKKEVAAKTAMPKDIVFKRSTGSLQALEQSFYDDKTYGKALHIAKRYYENKKYSSAIKWALKANEIDSSKEDSWIVFARSNIALGKLEVAMKAIDLYLEDYSSKELLKIKEDMFK